MNTFILASLCQVICIHGQQVSGVTREAKLGVPVQDRTLALSLVTVTTLKEAGAHGDEGGGGGGTP